MMKLSRETWILLLTGAAAAAALALGVAAFRLARHEEEFRKEELRSLLKSECRLFAGRCRQALDAERRELAELAAGAVPSVAGIREAVGREPLFTAGFLARQDGTLLYPEPGSSWARRYGELFAGLVSARDAESTQFSNVVMPSDSALLYQTRTAPKRNDLRRIEPMAGTLGSSRMENRTDVLREAEAVPVPEAAAPISKLKSKERSVRPAAPAKAAPAMEMAADAASPASADSPRMITRFAALTRKRRDGFIPWFTDNRFAPLIWAQSRNAPDLIAGFELEDTVLLSRLIPLFPEELPGYFRLELADAADRVVYATGGAFAANEEKRPEPVLVMPFSELLLPNMQLRAFLLPELLPTNSFRFGMGLALAALEQAYRQPVIGSGPVYREMVREAEAIRVWFDHIGSGLTAHGTGLKGFVIAGADGVFKEAEAQIVENSVRVSSPEVSDPVAVRYAWADNPEEANLYNSAGLPATPFRTDRFPR